MIKHRIKLSVLLALLMAFALTGCNTALKEQASTLNQDLKALTNKLGDESKSDIEQRQNLANQYETAYVEAAENYYLLNIAWYKSEKAAIENAGAKALNHFDEKAAQFIGHDLVKHLEQTYDKVLNVELEKYRQEALTKKNEVQEGDQYSRDAYNRALAKYHYAGYIFRDNRTELIEETLASTLAIRQEVAAYIQSTTESKLVEINKNLAAAEKEYDAFKNGGKANITSSFKHYQEALKKRNEDLQTAYKTQIEALDSIDAYINKEPIWKSILRGVLTQTVKEIPLVSELGLDESLTKSILAFSPDDILKQATTTGGNILIKYADDQIAKLDNTLTKHIDKSLKKAEEEYSEIK
ncbi:hypothetical protein [Cerasicoccus maritimus]|uniref:hypothetical protein n=1 Tax=Cerasicoccus maritimus TaxID=490089 RepID=UPI002852AAF4|nr:hypothetical protein [Cerasicoccus maritimus]